MTHSPIDEYMDEYDLHSRRKKEEPTIEEIKQRREEQKIERAYDAGKWFQLPGVFVKLLGFPDAGFLAIIINISGMVPLKYRIKGFFPCSVKRIEKLVGYNGDAQWARLKSLEKKGYIKISKKGIPARRYIRINYAFLERQVVDIYDKEDLI